MTSRRRSGVRAWLWFTIVSAVVLVLGSAEVILRHPAAQVAAVVVVPLITFALGCWASRPRQIASGPRQVLEDHKPDELARLRDENAKLRAKVRVLAEALNGPEVRP